MSLLGSIAAALSEGVGGGMLQNAKWGEEKAAQAKKEAADDARLKEHLKRYDDDRLSREAMNAANLEDSKAARAAQAEENRLNRLSNEKIAGMHARSAGGSGEISSLRELNMIYRQITSMDNTIEDLNKAYAAEVDPEKQKAIAGQIDAWRAKRQAFVTSDIVQQTIASNGKLGQLYGAALYGGASTADPAQAQEGNIPASLVVPPPRAVVKPGEGGLLSNMAGMNPTINPGSGDVGPNAADQAPPVSDLEAVGQRYLSGDQRADQHDWSKLKAPQGGWHSPVKTKEVQYPNGQKGYTIEWAN